MFQAFFWKKLRFAHFGQKLPKIGHFGPKCPIHYFAENSKMASFGQNWTKFDHFYHDLQIFRQKFWNFIFYFFSNRKNKFGGKIHFLPLMTHLLSPLSPHLEKFLKWRFFAFFFEKYKKQFFYFFSWNTVNIVEVEIFDFSPFSNWPDFDQK